MNPRVKRIHGSISMLELLASYSSDGYYDVDPHDSREQQYRCDLHGQDGKPSARVYPETNSTFCFACGKARDPVAFLMEKEGLSFRDACKQLEDHAGLPPWTYDAPAREENPSGATMREIEVLELTRSVRTFDQESKRVARLLTNATDSREYPLERILTWWEVYDRIQYGVKRQDWPESQGKEGLLKIRTKVMEFGGNGGDQDS